MLLDTISLMNRPVPTPPPKRFTTVEEESAGGLVVDISSGDQPVALIARRDKKGRLVWSIPKGHIESGESREDAAVREVEEETGILGTILAPLGTIDFWFVAEGKRIHKTVHHYLMTTSGGALSADDIEVETVEWVPLTDAPGRLAYPDERRLAERVSDVLAANA